MRSSSATATASLQRARSQRQLGQLERLRAIGGEGQPHLRKRRLEVGELDRQREHGALEIVIHFSEDLGQDLPIEPLLLGDGDVDQRLNNNASIDRRAVELVRLGLRFGIGLGPTPFDVRLTKMLPESMPPHCRPAQSRHT